MKRRFFFAIAALAAGIATPGAGFAQNTEGAIPATFTDEDRHNVLCILTTHPREERALEKIAFFFGRFSAKHPNSLFTPTLNAGMSLFRALDKGEQDALSQVCREEFRVAFG